MEKTFKITPKKVQRTLQRFQLVLLKVTRNEKTPDQLFILISSAFKNRSQEIRKKSSQEVSRFSPSIALSISQKTIHWPNYTSTFHTKVFSLRYFMRAPVRVKRYPQRCLLQEMFLKAVLHHWQGTHCTRAKRTSQRLLWICKSKGGRCSVHFTVNPISPYPQFCLVKHISRGSISLILCIYGKHR